MTKLESLADLKSFLKKSDKNLFEGTLAFLKELAPTARALASWLKEPNLVAGTLVGSGLLVAIEKGGLGDWISQRFAEPGDTEKAAVRQDHNMQIAHLVIGHLSFRHALAAWSDPYGQWSEEMDQDAFQTWADRVGDSLTKPVEDIICLPLETHQGSHHPVHQGYLDIFHGLTEFLPKDQVQPFTELIEKLEQQAHGFLRAYQLFLFGEFPKYRDFVSIENHQTLLAAIERTVGLIQKDRDTVTEAIERLENILSVIINFLTEQSDTKTLDSSGPRIQGGVHHHYYGALERNPVGGSSTQEVLGLPEPSVPEDSKNITASDEEKDNENHEENQPEELIEKMKREIALILKEPCWNEFRGLLLSKLPDRDNPGDSGLMELQAAEGLAVELVECTLEHDVVKCGKRSLNFLEEIEKEHLETAKIPDVEQVLKGIEKILGWLYLLTCNPPWVTKLFQKIEESKTLHAPVGLPTTLDILFSWHLKEPARFRDGESGSIIPANALDSNLVESGILPDDIAQDVKMNLGKKHAPNLYAQAQVDLLYKEKLDSNQQGSITKAMRDDLIFEFEFQAESGKPYYFVIDKVKKDEPLNVPGVIEVLAVMLEHSFNVLSYDSRLQNYQDPIKVIVHPEGTLRGMIRKFFQIKKRITAKIGRLTS